MKLRTSYVGLALTLIGLGVLAAGSSAAKEAPAPNISMSVENYERSKDSSSNTFSLTLTGSTLVCTMPDRRTCHRGRCDSKTLKGTLTKEQGAEFWKLARKSPLWTSFEEKKPTTGRGSFTKVMARISHEGHSVTGLVTGREPVRGKEDSALSQAAQAYRDSALKLHIKACEWLSKSSERNTSP